MLLEAAVEDKAALLPLQYQTNYREEYQYSGLHTGQYVSSLSCRLPFYELYRPQPQPQLE